MRAERGICVAVDRASQKVLVQFPAIEGENPAIVPLPYLGDPPAPLSFVLLQEIASGSFVVVGAIGDQHTRMSDDFDQFADYSPAVYGDSAWQAVGTSTGAMSSPALGYGVARLQTAGAQGLTDHIGLRKANHSIVAPPALWLEIKVAISTTTDRWAKFGLVDVAGAGVIGNTNEVTMSTSSSVNGGAVQLVATSGGNASVQDTGFVPAPGEFFVVHILVNGGAFAAAWIATEPTANPALPDMEADYTVQGPLFVTTNIPSTDVCAGFGIQQLSTSSVYIDIDYFRVHTVWPIATPEDLVSGATTV